MAKQLSSLSLSALSILIVEDHAIQRMVLRQVMGRLGVTRLDEAENGMAALSCLDKNQYDFMICDLDMPQLDGIQLMRKLRQYPEPPPIIFYSAQPEEILHSVRRIALHHELVVVGCLSKPLLPAHVESLMLAHARFSAVKTAAGLGRAGHFTRSEILTALDEGQIRPWYQPKIDPQTLRVVSVEALARWEHPQYGVIAPGVFLPRIDEMGLSEMLFFVMLKHAICDCHDWDSRFPGLQLGVAININVREFDQPDMPNKIQSILRSDKFLPSRITIELTETQPLENLSYSLENAIRLRVMGFHLALDDFGAGYSGFHHLREIPATSVKIDRTLVHRAAGDPAAEKLLGFAVRMLQNQNVSVVVEGVSRQTDFELVKQMHVDLVQGFLFAEAMPASGLADFVAKQAVAA